MSLKLTQEVTGEAAIAEGLKGAFGGKAPTAKASVTGVTSNTVALTLAR